MKSTESFEVNKSMFELFQTEIQTHTKVLHDNLEILEEDSSNLPAIENCMRSALSIKGAAQLVKIQLALKLAANIENFFIFTQANKSDISPEQYTALVDATKYLSSLSTLDIDGHEKPDSEILIERDSLIRQFESFINIDIEPKSQSKDNEPLKTDAKNELTDLANDIDPMMFELFKTELENNVISMSDSLLLLETETDNEDELERLMRSSHSIKGAARLLGLEPVVKLAHVLEDCFVSAQNNTLTINTSHIDLFLQCVDLFKTISSKTANEFISWISDNLHTFTECTEKLSFIENNKTSEQSSAKSNSPDKTVNILTFGVPDNIDPGMLDLFKTELKNNIDVISNSLLELENDPKDSSNLEQLMRSSHSIKGAARLLGIESVVNLAHIMEDCFVAAQNHSFTITNDHIDVFLKCIDILIDISSLTVLDHKEWTNSNSITISHLLHDLKSIEDNSFISSQQIMPSKKVAKPRSGKPRPKKEPVSVKNSDDDSIVRVSSKRINNLMGLAGELTVTSNWVKTYSTSMLGLKKKHNELIDTIDRLRTILEERKLTDLEKDLLSTIQHKASNHRDSLTTHIIDLDDFDRRAGNLSGRISHQIISSRMRPFKDSTQGYKRMVRDISRSLNKKIQLEIIGEETQVDREILEKIEAPVNHMIRNAIDHGIEMPELRLKNNKPETGTIQLKASHNAGRLSITVSDDGRGVDIENIREKVLQKKLVNKNMAENLSKSELLDFLFLPAFSTKDNVTEISGRGVGLDVVHSALQDMRGKLHSQTELGKGMSIHMELPLTLSVIRSLLVKVNEELYAFPLAAIHKLITINNSDIFILEDKQYITLDGNNIGLIHAAQILGLPNKQINAGYLSVIIIGDWHNFYGVVVDDMIGERGLALRPLDSRLGKVKDINSTALTDNGEPILVFDVDDLIQSIQAIINEKNITKIGQSDSSLSSVKRILVVDDSLTVREVEKKLLESRGYNVDIAIDGVDAWNTVRSGNYDLVVSDVDMPRMNGIELVTLIKNDAALRNMPVMMVSYKDRPEDRQKGLDAGADYYLTKGSFHDETLIDAVVELIGAPIK